jgi:hypothetical protein
MNEHKQTDVAITPQAVRAQLGRILASEVFARSRRMQRFLEFVVEETLAGRADQLGEYAVGMAVFDRGPDFEPALDPIVRNDARRLRLKLLEYYRQTHPRPGDQVLIDVPKGGYVPVFLMVSPQNGRLAPPAGPAQRVALLPFEVLSEAPDGVMFGRAVLTPVTNENASKADGAFRVLTLIAPVSADVQTWAHEFYFEVSGMPAVPSGIAARECLPQTGGEDSRTPRLVRVHRQRFN